MDTMYVLTVSDYPAAERNDSGDEWESNRDLSALSDVTETSTFKVFAGLDGGYKFWQIWQGSRLVKSGKIFQE